MSYTVVWMPTAERRLTQIWLDAPDKLDITNASNAIDRQLRLNPRDAGESRVSNLRLLFVAPLAILFEVDIQDRKVKVRDVWRHPN